MMAALEQWLTGVTAVAMLIALADCLTPKGAVLQVVRLVGGLLLLLAVTKPLITLDFSALTTAAIWQEVTQPDVLKKINDGQLKVIIAQETGAYILDKAEAMDIPCDRVEVTCDMGTQGLPYPDSVVLYGVPKGQQPSLARVIEQDLAIPTAEQIYEEEGAP